MIITQVDRKVKPKKPAISNTAILHDSICAGCWDYATSFVIEYPFDDWTAVHLCRGCMERAQNDYRQRDQIIRNAGRFMGIWTWTEGAR